MSDTPRTDEQINGKPCTRFAILVGDSLRDALVASEFARQLERELNAANERIKRLEELVEQLTNPKFTRDDLPKEALLQRIKRLEEAGDHLCSLLGVDSIEAHMGRESWSEAKEAKP